ncbi:hypothetical protein [Saccharothrix sp. Mg75]|uniref:hypothetical protein n=1 Tax=Saccharothrix sp. Mg75 TaxID=3445357 RepID=UPI003EE9FAD1
MIDDKGPRQYNAPAAGGNVYANQGGTQNIYAQEARDHFRDGLEALKHHLYPQALDLFETYLATAPRAGLADAADAEAQVTLACAHVYAAMALLSGSPPSYRTPEEVLRVNRHLENALKADPAHPVHSQASVLWAIVKDDYYDADGMPAPPPDAATLRRGVGMLGPHEVTTLVEHVAPARGETWRALTTRAGELGIPISVAEVDEVRRGGDPRRAEAVRKYFTPTPEPRQAWPWQALAATAALLVLVGLIAGDPLFLVVCFAGAFFAGRAGFRLAKEYREYLRLLAAAEPKPSDRRMDEWLGDDVEHIKRKAARRLRLNIRINTHGGDLVVPAQVVVGIPRSQYGAARRVRMCRGGDGELRANTYDVVILFLTGGLVSAYRGLLDFESGDVLFDETQEHHYQDIVGVSSTSIPMPKPLSELVEVVYGIDATISLAHQFRLSITSGEALEVDTGYSGPVAEANGKVAWRNNEHALNVIQKLVRARHGAR